jgi:hypothetical protein
MDIVYVSVSEKCPSSLKRNVRLHISHYMYYIL